jgi:Uncharacterized membrane protein (DUF2298)
MVETMRGRRQNTRTVLAPWVVALSVAAFWMLVIWAIHRDSPRTLVSFHGFIHAAIAERFLDSTSVSFPPENPFYAGRSVPYYWFFQFLAAQVARVLGWNVFHALEAVILAATGTLMIVSVGVGRAVFRSTLSGVLIGYLVVAGTNPFGFIFAGLKASQLARHGMLHEGMAIRGTQRLTGGPDSPWAIVQHGYSLIRHPLDTMMRYDSPDYLWGVVHPLYSLIRFNDFGGLYGPLLNFFLNMASRPVALAALMTLVSCLAWGLRKPGLLSCGLLGCASALTTSFNPIIGISGGGALLVGLAAFWRYRVSNTPPPGRSTWRVAFLAVGLAIVAGILLAAPTYYHLLFGPHARPFRFQLFSVAGVWHLATVASSILVLAILAVCGAFRAPPDRLPLLLTLVVAAFVLLAADVAFHLPAGNQSNFFHAAVVFLAVPAAGSIMHAAPPGEQPLPSPRRAIGIVLVFLPTLLLLLAAYLHRPPLPLEFEGAQLRRVPQNSDLARLYRWVQNTTSTRAVFIVDPRRDAQANRPLVAMCGNMAEFPAMTGRMIFTEHYSQYTVAPYPDSKMRFDMAVRLVSGGEPDGSDGAYASALKRPIYIVIYHPEDVTLLSRMQQLYGSPVFHAGSVSVFKWLD